VFHGIGARLKEISKEVYRQKKLGDIGARLEADLKKLLHLLAL
jgi:hypothetical protein